MGRNDCSKIAGDFVLLLLCPSNDVGWQLWAGKSVYAHCPLSIIC